MKRTRWLKVLALYCASVPLGAQTCPFNLEHIASKAKESVDITLDSNTLKLAGQFLAGEPDARSLLTGVKAICIRNYEFAKEGEYSPDDLQRVRNQLRAPLWSRIVHTQEKNESSEIFARTEGGRITGIAIVAAEPKELHVVYIDGAIDIDKLSGFGQQLGIPPIPGAARKPSK